MPHGVRRLLFALFFMSGFCGLLYQVVWVRMAYASFGVITPVLSIVISVFMLGLFAGSWMAGKVVGPLSSRRRPSAVWLYAAAELLIAAGAFAVPRLLALGETWLLRAGESDSFTYLLWSGLILAAVILPWCIFMGATFPLMMAFVKERDGSERASFSFLYLANVIGAMAGTLVTAVVLIEALGLGRTLLVAASMNLFVALCAAALGLRPGAVPAPAREAAAPVPAARPPANARAIALILFTTGFTSMAMEVAWTRAFTAVLGTQVYSFAALLFGYLLATWVGSLAYRRDLAKGGVVPTERIVAWLAIAATLPIVLNDPRLHLHIAGVFLGILPFCGLLGYLTPKLIDRYSAGSPDAAGFSYALNVLGCIVGPLFASYALLPLLGVKLTLLLLAAPYLVLLAIRRTRKVGYAAAALFLVASFVSKTYEDQVQGFHGEGLVRRDYTATVISYGQGMERRLLVNGVGMTHLTTITKVMAHLPLAVVGEPRSALAICFGMGTTYRSLLSWKVRATAVELIPGVKESFPYFFDDAAALLRRPEGKIVVDDGRRFLRRTAETFDVITLDPPPPVEAAASSLLHSEEFYAAAKARLTPGGIVQQWVPDTERRIVQAVARSLLASFPYVKMYRSFEGPGLDESGFGYHFLASLRPIEVPSAEVLAARMPESAKADLVEWVQDKDPARFLREVLDHETDPEEFARGSDVRITDDRPFNEYYLLRRLLPAMREPVVAAARAAVEAR